MIVTRNSIRKQMQNKRAQLSSGELASNSQTATKIFLESDLYQNSNHIGFYMAHKGELNPAGILTSALTDGKNCYLPTLDPMSDNQLIYVHYTTGQSLVTNRYNIPEPIITPTNVIGGRGLDVVLVPLVSFDHNGNRLGMGKGYYDRTFAFKNNDRESSPALVGFAHAFQQSESFDHKAWDVPLDYVVTEQGLVRFEH